MQELYNYFSQFISNSYVLDVFMACTGLVLLSLVLSIFGWLFGRRS